MRNLLLLFSFLIMVHTLYAQPSAAAPTPTHPANEVISMFSDAYTDVGVDTWRTSWSSADFSDTQVAGDDVKLYENLDFVGIETTGANIIDASGMTHFNVDIWTPNMTTVRVKLVDFGADGAFGGGDDSDHEIVMENPTQNEWVTWSIPLSDFSTLASTTHMAQLIFSGLPTSSSTLYVDNVYYSNVTTGGGNAPTAAAPTPTCPTTDVISMFSDAYTDVPVDTWRTDWSQGDLTDTDVAGNAVKLYENVNFVGIETVMNQIDATNMTHFNLDIWTPNMTQFRVKLVDFGANGAFDNGGADDSEHEITIENPNQNEWVTLSLALADFTGLTARANISQLILAGMPVSEGTLYVDNVYFSGNCGNTGGGNAPTAAAPTPTCPTAEVISMFSDAYTDVPVDTWRTDWSQGDLTDTDVAGNAVKLYENVNFVGIETVMNQIDATNMTHFNVDIWTPNMTQFRVKLVDFGANGAFDNGGADDSEHEITIDNPNQNEWVTLSLALADFTGLTARANISQLILAGMPVSEGTLYVDNVYFSGNCGNTGGGNAPTAAAPTPTCPTAEVISMFSDAYTDVPVDTWRTDWSQGDLTDTDVAGNAVKLYENVNFVGIETVMNQIDATNMTHFNLDIWTPNMTQFRVKLVDFGANGAFDNGGADDSEHEVTIDNPNQNEWVTLSLPLENFTGLTARANISQLIFAGTPVGAGTLYVDNVYFSTGCGPVPTAKVVFSVDMNNYMGMFNNVYVSGTFNNWSGDANPLADPDGDGVWTGTITIPHGTHEYKFTLDNWMAEEQFMGGESCTITTNGFTNRSIEVMGNTDLCFQWNSCDACTCPVLLWADEFDGTSLDMSKWTPQIGDGCDLGICGWGNAELQYYRSENATVADGKLSITAKQEDFGGKNYTSARLRTLGKGDWTYGRFEASIKLPTGQGIWPAFWLLHTDGVYGAWPKSGEIDIMENIGSQPEKVFGTLHYGQNGHQFMGTEYDLHSGSFSDAFHEFAIEWEENEIRWYVDDYLYATKKASDIAPEFWPFDQDFHFILNVAVGGTLPGNPDGTTMFPQTMEVDYVRVYKGYGPTITGQREVINAAQGVAYRISNAPAGTTLNWSVPTGATIASGQGTNEVEVNWGDTDSSGALTCTIDDGCEMKTITLDVQVEQATVLEESLLNFDGDDAITFQATGTTGTLEVVNTPTANNLRGGAMTMVGKYTRNSGEVFDVLLFDTNNEVPNANDFSTNSKKFHFDLYTAAPIGTKVILQLENTAVATPVNYPAGRHSRYEIVTTKQNSWERLEFEFLDQPDGSTDAAAIDRMVVLFAPNSSTNDVYFMDNLEIRCTDVNNCSPALSLDWLGFNAERVEQTVQLDWATANEKENVNFTIERASNTQDFVAIGEVKPLNTENARYQFIDRQPQTGTNYYRIAVRDATGELSYSPIRSVVFTDKGELIVYPNPTTGKINVAFTVAETQRKVMIEVMNVNGELVKSVTIPTVAGYQTRSIDLTDVARGLYLLRISTAAGYQTQRVIID